MNNTIPILDISHGPRHRKSESPLTIKTFNLRLVIATSTGTHLIPFAEIIHCTADSNYCSIELTDGRRIILSKTLKEIQRQLPARLFVRTHQSHLVNKSYVRFVSTNHILLSDGRKIPVARSRLAKLKKGLGIRQR